MGIKSFIKSFSQSRWDIGIITTPLSEILIGQPIKVDWIRHKFKDSWFADPFILDADASKIIMLVEEFYKPRSLGRISRLEVDRQSLEVLSRNVVLELETHLSFPFYMWKGDRLYIYPENSESGKWSRYLYDDSARECVFDGVVIEKPLSDAVITHAFGDEMIFTTALPNPNGNRLEIYRKNSKNEYDFLDAAVFEENVARMSGAFFEFHGSIYRPTQECNTQYGHAVTIQEVKYIGGKFSFQEVRRLYSVHPRFKVGMHTFNVYKDLIATDALTFDNMWLRRILMKFGIMQKR